MKPVLAKAALAASFGFLLSGAALAQTVNATATVDLNIRSGPGPQFDAIGVIAHGDAALVTGCVEGERWCQVDYDGVTGWAFTDYLTIEVETQAETEIVVLTERPPELIGPVDPGTTGSSAVTGAAGGAIVGTLLGGPVGAAVGTAVGASAGLAIDPPETARVYVEENPMEPVYLEGEVVVGAQVPETVTVSTIPDYEYEYVYINGLPVLIEPQTREVVYVFR